MRAQKTGWTKEAGGMSDYGQEEMDYLSGKDPVMARLIAHYGD